MSEMLIIRRKEQLWNDYIFEGFKHGWSKEKIREKLIEAIRKEVFDQMMWRLKVGDLREAPQTPENERIISNICINTRNKWSALIRMCEKYRDTRDLISMKDLSGLFGDEEETEVYNGHSVDEQAGCDDDGNRDEAGEEEEDAELADEDAPADDIPNDEPAVEA